jgi:hypothetical protein
MGKTLSAERLGANIFGFLGDYSRVKHHHSHSLYTINRKPLNAHLGQGLLFRSRQSLVADLPSAYPEDRLCI